MHIVAPTALRAPRDRVHPRAIWFWTARAAGGWIALLAVEVLVLIVGEHHIAGWRYAVVAASAALALAHVAVMPQWRYRVHRYELTDQAVYTQSGWFVQERRIAPVARIQTVDVHRGPLEQLFRLANVTVTTASAAGPLKIHGLDTARADRVVEDLTARIRAADGDAT
ncbi:MAG TPA: PH domain-containing protein [Jatrophihabitantaceae bacterium]|jgi:membrane protein YdbS with pleckstrin-like domain